MKTKYLQNMLLVVVVAGLTMSVSTVLAQNSAASIIQPAAVNAPAPQLSYGVPQILQLAQANVGDATIIAYIKNSGNSYALDADQIIYLRQQGISGAVINTMLNQPKPAAAMAVPATPAPQPVASTAYTAPVATATVAPTVTYVQTAPAPAPVYYYYQPYYYPAYSPAYGTFPALSLSFAWGGGGGGYGGGWRGGGWHR
jgi:hypothetical protein